MMFYHSPPMRPVQTGKKRKKRWNYDGMDLGSLSQYEQEAYLVDHSSLPQMNEQLTTVKDKDKPWYRSRWFWMAAIILILLLILLVAIIKGGGFRRRLPA